MQVKVVGSDGAGARDAIGRIEAQLPARADFLAVHFAPDVDAAAIAAMEARLAPRAFHGATSSRGVLARAVDTPAARSRIGCFLIEDPEGDYGTAAVRKGADPRGAAQRAVTEALAAAGRTGEAPDLIWLTATPGAEEEIIAGLQAVVGMTTPIIGGSAADDAVSGAWRLVSRAGVMDDGLVVTVMFPSAPVRFAFQNGYAPAGPSGLVTRADGRRVFEIDHRPAAERYAAWREQAGMPPGISAAPPDGPAPVLAETTMAPLGRRVAEVSGVPFFLLAHPATVYPDGSMELFSTVDEGEPVFLMTGSADGLAARAGRVARQALSGPGPGGEQAAGALLVYCGGCMLAVEDRLADIAAGIEAALGPTPFLTVFTFGEQGSVVDGMNRHGNLMVSCIVFTGDA